VLTGTSVTAFLFLKEEEPALLRHFNRFNRPGPMLRFKNVFGKQWKKKMAILTRIKIICAERIVCQ
jgi:hypothetical protein